jgi:hypothetical protein
MKPQSFLREMANYVFKQFCSELDEQSLGNLIEIISTPNNRAGEIADNDDEDDSDDESDEEEQIEAPYSASEDSDDSDIDM